MLQITALTTGHRGKTVSQHLSAKLTPATLTCLMGGNGTGKSTLLHTLCGLIPATGGSISIHGKELAEYGSKALAREIAIVLTHHPENLVLTAREVVAMGRQPHTGLSGRLSEADEEIISHSLLLAGAQAIEERLFSTLSDGERQRIMIAKALAQQTPIILLDEPTAFLDFSGKISILSLLRQLAHDSGKTILLSTHDLEPAFRLADKLWLLRNDGIVSGTPRELADRGTLAEFFNTPVATIDPANLRFEYQQ